jgi:cytochrome c553
MKKMTLHFLAALALTIPAHAAKGNVDAGKAKSTACAACHGYNGVSEVTGFPILAGQHRDYLVHALNAYKSGKRKNPVMAEQVKNLSETDIADLAAYFSSQKKLDVKY